MPIFEYACKTCGKEFEALVRPNSDAPSCPACQGTDLEKLLSIPAVKSDSTHALALSAAKKRDAKQANHNARVQREYELHHND
jgi:putative FmdB family regulatory protein